MHALRDPMTMQKVGFSADILSPLAKRAMLCKPQVDDHPRHRTQAEAIKLVQAEENTKHQTLLYLAVHGFAHKLLPLHS